MSVSEEFVQLVGEEKVFADVSLDDFAAFSKERAEVILGTTSLSIGVQGKLMKLHACSQQPTGTFHVGRTILDRFHLTRPVFCGGALSVYSAKDKQSDKKEEVAVKVVRCSYGSRAAIDLDAPSFQVRHELEILEGPLAGCPGTSVILAQKESPDEIVVVTKPFGRTLDDAIKEIPVPERHSMILQWGIRLVSILRDIHDRGVIHSDLKPSNILVTAENDLCIIDFGGATSVDHPVPGNVVLFTEAYSAETLMGIASKDGDNIALMYTLHALHFGVPKWEQLYYEDVTGRPTFKQLQSDPDSVVSLVLKETGLIISEFADTKCDTKQQLESSNSSSKSPIRSHFSNCQRIIIVGVGIIATALGFLFCFLA